MENSFQTSFIPKKPISSSAPIRERRSMGIFSLFSIIIVIAVCIWTGGLFLYKNYLTKQKAELSNSLSISRDSFEKKTIDNLEIFSKKITVSKDILKNHYVLYPLFKEIEKMTVPSIQFTKFDYQLTDNAFLVQMNGLARDYTSIALQDKEFNMNKNRNFRDVVFSELKLSESPSSKGYVSFKVTFTVDKNFLSYENNLILEKSNQSNITPILPESLNSTPSSILPDKLNP